MPRQSGRPDVTVESDEENRGTPYRTCSIAVYVRDLDGSQMDHVRAALSRIVSSPEVSVIATGRPTTSDNREFVRLRMVYYGEKLAAASISDAITGAI